MKEHIKIQDLTAAQKEDIDRHYRHEFKDLIQNLREFCGAIVKANDKFALLWLTGVFECFILETLKYLPDDDNDGEAYQAGQTIAGWNLDIINKKNKLN